MYFRLTFLTLYTSSIDYLWVASEHDKNKIYLKHSEVYKNIIIPMSCSDRGQDIRYLRSITYFYVAAIEFIFETFFLKVNKYE